MSKIVSISHDQQAKQRSPEEAIKELHETLAAVNASMAALGKMFPNTTVLAGFKNGEPCLTLAFSRSNEADHFSPCALNATQGVARVMLTMLPDLQDMFLLELKCAKEIRSLEHDMEVAVEAALRAAKTHST